MQNEVYYKRKEEIAKNEAIASSHQNEVFLGAIRTVLHCDPSWEAKKALIASPGCLSVIL